MINAGKTISYEELIKDEFLWLMNNHPEEIESFEKTIDLVMTEKDYDFFCDVIMKPYIESGEYIPKEKAEKRKPLLLPNNDKLISTFAEEVAEIIKEKKRFFFKTDISEVVEIAKVKEENKEKDFTGYKVVTADRFITLVEDYVVPYIENYRRDKVKHSMSKSLALTLLSSPQIQESLPRISTLFTVPMPMIYEGQLTFPKKRYDERFKSWLMDDAPEIADPNLSLQEGKEIIEKIYSEFCFQTEQDKINAIAGLLTPFLRGLYSEYNALTPVFFYKANRERSGKDYCAGITGIVYEGIAMEDAPISSGDNFGNSSEELRKKITAAKLIGRKRMHFSNNRGHIDNAVFESVITNKKYSDRVLGQNKMFTSNNEMEWSLSGNVGVTFTPDLANRCRFVNLFLDIEDANSRKFNNPLLHEWVKENRGLILSALYALVRNWVEKGKPKGTVPFSSFPEWADVCGGIMESAGYSSPCTKSKENGALSVDSETADFKVLFELCYARYPNQWITKREIMDTIRTEELFGNLNLYDHGNQIKFGIKLSKFIGRILSDIRLEVDNIEARGSRQKFRFIHLGYVGGVGHVLNPVKQILYENSPRYIDTAELAELAENKLIFAENSKRGQTE